MARNWGIYHAPRLDSKRSKQEGNPVLGYVFKSQENAPSKATDHHNQQKDHIERLLFLLNTIQNLMSKSRPDLLRFNLDLDQFNALMENLNKVDLTEISSKEKFQADCARQSQKILKRHHKNASKMSNPHSDYFWGMVPFHALAQARLFGQTTDMVEASWSGKLNVSDFYAALAKKSFLAELTEVALSVYKNYLLTKRYLEAKHIPTKKLCLLKYRQTAQETLSIDQYKELSACWQSHDDLEKKIQNAYLNYMGVLGQVDSEDIPRIIHASLHFYKKYCFDGDDTHNNVVYLTDYILQALELENAIQFDTDVPDVFGSHKIGLSKSFFAFCLAALLKSDIFISPQYNRYTSEYCLYQVESFESQILDLFQPTFTVNFDPSRQNREKHKKKLSLALQLSEQMGSLSISSSSGTPPSSNESRNSPKMIKFSTH